MKKLLIFLAVAVMMTSCNEIHDMKNHPVDGRILMSADGMYYRVSHELGVLYKLKSIDTADMKYFIPLEQRLNEND